MGNLCSCCKEDVKISPRENFVTTPLKMKTYSKLLISTGPFDGGYGFYKFMEEL